MSTLSSQEKTSRILKKNIIKMYYKMGLCRRDLTNDLTTLFPNIETQNYSQVIEIFCNHVVTLKFTLGENYTDGSPWQSYNSHEIIAPPVAKYLFAKLSWNLEERGEKDFLIWYKKCKDFLQESYENNVLEFIDDLCKDLSI